jgi:hypothetical protein
MDELADRPEPSNMSANFKAARLQSFVEILPDGSPKTTTIALALPAKGFASARNGTDPRLSPRRRKLQ